MEIVVENNQVSEMSYITIKEGYVNIEFGLQYNDTTANKFFKAITQMLDKNELDELLAEHGYVNRDSLIGGGL